MYEIFRQAKQRPCIYDNLVNRTGCQQPKAFQLVQEISHFLKAYLKNALEIKIRKIQNLGFFGSIAVMCGKAMVILNSSHLFSTVIERKYSKSIFLMIIFASSNSQFSSCMVFQCYQLSFLLILIFQYWHKPLLVAK